MNLEFSINLGDWNESFDISTNAEALRVIADAIKKYNEDQLALLAGYLQTITRINSGWDDTAYDALFEAVVQETIKIQQLMESIDDFPPYLHKLADIIDENEKLANGGV